MKGNMKSDIKVEGSGEMKSDIKVESRAEMKRQGIEKGQRKCKYFKKMSKCYKKLQKNKKEIR